MREMEREALEMLCEDDRTYADELYRKFSRKTWIACICAVAALVLAVLLWYTQGWTPWETLTVFSLPVTAALWGYLHIQQHKFTEFLALVPEFRLPVDYLNMFKHADPKTAQRRQIPFALAVVMMILIPPVGIVLLAMRSLKGNEQIVVLNAEDALNVRAKRQISHMTWSGVWLFLLSISMVLICTVAYIIANSAAASRNAAARTVYRCAMSYVVDMSIRDQSWERGTLIGEFGADAEDGTYAAYLREAMPQQRGWYAVSFDGIGGAVTEAYYSPRRLTEDMLGTQETQKSRMLIASVLRWYRAVGSYTGEAPEENTDPAETTSAVTQEYTERAAS